MARKITGLDLEVTIRDNHPIINQEMHLHILNHVKIIRKRVV